MNRILLSAAVTALVLASCDDGDGSESEDTSDSESTAGDTEADGETDAALSCETAPVLTYDTFGRGFLATYCNGCHGSGAPDRQGAPPDSIFDDAAQASQWGPRIQARVFPVEGTPPMPPAGGITPDDLERARIWLECYP